MAVETQEKADGKVLVVSASGKLTREDYERFLPKIQRRIDQHGKVRILFDMRDFHGWTFGAFWQDLKFGLKYFRDIERLAMIGNKVWEHLITAFCRPFTKAKIRYFDRCQADQAFPWIEADLPVAQASGLSTT